MHTYIAGDWVARGPTIHVRSPYTNQIIDTVPEATLDDVERALAAAVEGAETMRALPAHRRASILDEAANLIEADIDKLAETITLEQGKYVSEAQAEASRIAGILRLCAAEALRLYGEVLPMDAAPVGVGRLGYTRPEPTGVVVAITPFNYPAILVIHKVGPALAAGTSVILKPATTTPLTSVFLVERLIEAGLPPLALQCLIGPGSTVGQALCTDTRVRKISFTGSYAVGKAIAQAAGVKRLTCELGSNASLLVLDDADIERAAHAAAFSGYTNSGQNCVSTQRIVVHDKVHDVFVDALAEQVDRLRPGDPADPETTLAPVITPTEAERILEWVMEARDRGGTLHRGGDRVGSLVSPVIVLNPPLDSRLWQAELFGPGVAVRAVESNDELLAAANDSRYGLAVSVMTNDLDRAVRFAHGLRSGMVNINPPTGSTWRADFMPWGGFGDSGFGKEGVRYAIKEMTEEKLVIIHPRDTT